MLRGMALLTVFALALGLSMDAVAVAMVTSLRSPRVTLAQALGMALCFGAFQAAMPLLGWLVGAAAGPYLRAIDHWVAFVILAVIGGKMLFEAWQGIDAPEARGWPSAGALLILGLATSIDAAAAGITLTLVELPILVSVTIIGAVTFILVAAAVPLGKRLGQRWGTAAEILGGVVLIALGTKILVEHLTA